MESITNQSIIQCTATGQQNCSTFYVDIYYNAGHDTTTSGMSWTLYSLAAHPEFQRKCQQEIDELLAGREDDTIQW